MKKVVVGVFALMLALTFGFASPVAHAEDSMDGLSTGYTEV